MQLIFKNNQNKRIFFLVFILVVVLPLISTGKNVSDVQALDSGLPNYLWSISPADAPSGVMKIDLKVDTADHLHLAMGRDNLYYAYSENGAIWNSEMVDSLPGAGSELSLAVDTNGMPHIAYQVTTIVNDKYKFPLRYAVKNDTQWIIETVDTNVRGSSALALDNSNNPHLVYGSATASVLKYATWTGSQWDIQSIDSCADPDHVSIKIDSNEFPRILYNCAIPGSLRFAFWDGTEWNIQTLEAGFNSSSISFELDSQDHPHIAYTRATQELKYLSWNGSGWQTDVVTSPVYEASLDLDISDLPRIAYSDVTNPDNRILKYAKFNGSSWELQTLDPNFVGFVTLALDHSQEPHIVYQTKTGNIRYIAAVDNNGVEEWSQPVDVIDPTAWVGNEASLTLDTNGKPHAAYLDHYRNQLRYAHWTGSTWNVQIVDTLNNYHAYPTIKTDNNSDPHIAYFGNGGLKYASWNGSAWDIVSVNGLSGNYASLVLDTNGHPHIAFCGGYLKYVFWNGTSWSVETINSVCGGGDFGGEVSLTIDASNVPRIAFTTNTDAIVTVATRDVSNNIWNITSLGEIGIGISQALDGSGIPHIAFCHPGPTPVGGQIRYASWDGSGWDITTAGIGNCQINSLSIGGDDIPHISFPDYHFNSLEHIYWDGSSWHQQRIQEGILWTGLSYYTPVAVDSSGVTWIAFMNWIDGDLYMAKGIKTNETTPANDQFANATGIEPLPSQINENVVNATGFLSDPILPCTKSRETETVWFKFTPTQNGMLSVDTVGSNYDTVLGVWEGSWGDLISIACNNDFVSSLQSKLEVNLTGGTTYYIEVASRTADAGQLSLNSSFTNDPCNNSYTLTIVVLPAGSGIASADPTPTCPGGKYLAGTNVTLTADPNAGGYTFKSWSSSAYSTTNPFTITMNKNMWMEANFNLPPVPSTPVLVSPAVNTLVKTYTPQFDWANSTIPANTSFGYYEIQVDNNGDFSSLLVSANTQNGNIADSKFTPSFALPSNTKLYWRVRAFNSANKANNWSAVWSFRTALTPPTLVSPVPDYNALSLRPAFDWDSVLETGVTGYTIQISKNNTFTQVVNTGNPVTSTYTANLPKNLTLFWRVKTKGVNGPSAWSEVRNFNSANSPSTPALSLPANNSLNKTYLPLFKWSVVTLPAGTTFKHYQLQVDDNADFSSLVINDTSITDRLVSQFQVVTPLAHNTKFYWRVRAVNMDDEVGNWSAVRTLRAIVDAPVLLSPADGSPAGTRKPIFDWEDASGPGAITNYTIQVSTSPAFSSFLLNKNVPSSTYTMLVNLPAGKTLYWRVRVNGANGPSAWTVFSFSTP